MVNHLTKIKHVVQLMLENRSFDQMLGFLYTGQKNAPQFDGLTGEESNPDGSGGTVKVRKILAADDHPYFMPGADPGEGFFNTNLQLYSAQHPDRTKPPTNDGFVVNFANAIASDQAQGYKDSIPGTQASQIMSVYTPELLPVMSALARGYALCDCWFASAPTQTIPNRAFAGAGTSQGRLDNKVKSFTCDSIYGRLTTAKRDWAIYGYKGTPLTRTDFPDTLHAASSHFGKFKDFVARAKAGKLPAYTFLEPDFGIHGNSQHPNYDVSAGEQLIHDVYYALRQNADAWASTLLLITYDEHGGNYDHVPPPYGAAPPDGSVGEFDNFDFRSFGVRIPALLVSPLIAEKTVFRPSSGVVDHTSVLKTLEELFGLTSLTARDRNAPSLGDAISLSKARSDDPLDGVKVPKPTKVPFLGAAPSELELVHASRVSQLPIPDANEQYKRQPEPTFRSSAEIQDYIDGRMARWDAHLASRRSVSGVAQPYRTKHANIVRAHPREVAALRHGDAKRRPARGGGSHPAGQPAGPTGHLAAGFTPHPSLDMTFHGGKTIPALAYLNVYLGKWDSGDIKNIDDSLSAAMTDPGLNAILNQYFTQVAGGVQTKFLGSSQRKDVPPATYTRDDVSATLNAVRNGTKVADTNDVNFDNTVICLLLPKGVVLDTTAAAGVGTIDDDDDKLTSLQGLGGYHGSHEFDDGTTAYFAVSVYSEGDNGIPAFDESWKSVVATLYHELTEARTDPDVEEVNRTGNSKLLGWYGDARGAGEIGDIPINEAGGDLSKVFVEVKLKSGPTVPVQLMWSNAANGPAEP